MFEDRLIVALEDATATWKGGAGCIPVSANVRPGHCAALHSAWEAGDLTRFGHLRDQLDPLNAALFTERNPIPVKAASSEMELCADAVRLPLTRATLATRQRLRAVLTELPDVPPRHTELRPMLAVD